MHAAGMRLVMHLVAPVALVCAVGKCLPVVESGPVGCQRQDKLVMLGMDDTGVGEVKGRQNGCIGGGFERHDGVGGELCERVDYAISTGCPYPDSIASVMMQCWTKVPAINGMGGACAPDTRFLINQYVGARWWQGSRCSQRRRVLGLGQRVED
jgi:hypothetical protein